MCIYCGTTKYRKIYEQHNGPIPVDENNKSYDIHHMDGNKQNNHPNNLKCVSIKEHYDIHYSQGDWGACQLIAAQRLNKNTEEISDIARKAALQQIADGKHPWVGDGTHQRRVQAKRVASGTHNLQGSAHNAKRVAEGTHPNMRRSDGTSASLDRVKAGTHNWQKREDGSSLAADRVKIGEHHFLGETITTQQLKNGTHPSQQVWKCNECGKEGKHRGAYTRFHGEKCRKGSTYDNK